ncbi:hypothetical protein SASPL_109670 [Salvia splendens]|uniref:Uncharacterized protein n=1 Tax=Salvia splendens TaxID=180675 RepID=A0A8X9A8L6_SALSN|nr:hypothetical protein SASPL_109670 [Salvia splendens]
MSLLWDLHLSLDHMRHEGVVPDLVTYGCVVDAYLDKRLGRNLNFALTKLNSSNLVPVQTDPLVFEVVGKGDFHLSSDAVMEQRLNTTWYSYTCDGVGEIIYGMDKNVCLPWIGMVLKLVVDEAYRKPEDMW